MGEDVTSQRQADAGSAPGGSSPSPGLWVLLALRFALELALLAAYAVACARLVDGWPGIALGAAAAVAVAVVWGLLLSPRRRIAAPVAVRVVVELLLFAAAGLLLAASGLPALGAALVLSEVVVLSLLQGPDKHAL